MYTLLGNDRISVRELTLDDAAPLAVMFADPAINYPTLPHLGKTPLEQAECYLQYGFDGQRQNGRSYHMLAIVAGNAFAGTATVIYDAKTKGIDELGWMVGPRYRGHNYAAHATALTVWSAMMDGRQQFEARIMHDNTVSIRVAEKLGLQFHEATRLRSKITGEEKNAVIYRGNCHRVKPTVEAILGL